jgi:pimeloyl-ACP methyl ester carboxylesterase
MHATSWDDWLRLFNDEGYAAIAPLWPGEAATVEETRSHADAMAGVGVSEVVDHYREVIAGLPAKPIVIGHSFGGLVVQQLLGMGLATGAVALCPAQFRGVLSLPLAAVRSAWPILSRPGQRQGTWAHSPESYHRNFANGVAQEESDAVFDRYVIPAPRRPLFQAGLANLQGAKASATVVDTRGQRGPLLMVAGGADRTVPEAVVRSAYNKQKKNPGVTEFLSFPGRGHSLPADSGWRDVAQASLDFLARNNLSPRSPVATTAT